MSSILPDQSDETEQENFTSTSNHNRSINRSYTLNDNHTNTKRGNDELNELLSRSSTELNLSEMSEANDIKPELIDLTENDSDEDNESMQNKSNFNDISSEILGIEYNLNENKEKSQKYKSTPICHTSSHLASTSSANVKSSSAHTTYTTKPKYKIKKTYHNLSDDSDLSESDDNNQECDHDADHSANEYVFYSHNGVDLLLTKSPAGNTITQYACHIARILWSNYSANLSSYIILESNNKKLTKSKRKPFEDEDDLLKIRKLKECVKKKYDISDMNWPKTWMQVKEAVNKMIGRHNVKRNTVRINKPRTFVNKPLDQNNNPSNNEEDDKKKSLRPRKGSQSYNLDIFYESDSSIDNDYDDKSDIFNKSSSEDEYDSNCERSNHSRFKKAKKIREPTEKIDLLKVYLRERDNESDTETRKHGKNTLSDDSDSDNDFFDDDYNQDDELDEDDLCFHNNKSLLDMKANCLKTIPAYAKSLARILWSSEYLKTHIIPDEKSQSGKSERKPMKGRAYNLKIKKLKCYSSLILKHFHN